MDFLHSFYSFLMQACKLYLQPLILYPNPEETGRQDDLYITLSINYCIWELTFSRFPPLYREHTTLTVNGPSLFIEGPCAAFSLQIKC